MGKMSREKGKRGERHWASLCREYGFDCRRTAQFCGKTGEAADVVGIPGIHQEVKWVESLNLRKAMEQAERDCGDNVPIVAHKKNGKEWLVTMWAVDWLEMMRNIEQYKHNSVYPVAYDTDREYIYHVSRTFGVEPDEVTQEMIDKMRNEK